MLTFYPQEPTNMGQGRSEKSVWRYGLGIRLGSLVSQPAFVFPPPNRLGQAYFGFAKFISSPAFNELMISLRNSSG